MNKTQVSIIERFNMTQWFMRVIALLQTFCFLFVFYSPSVHAAVESSEQNSTVEQVQGNSDEEKLSNALQAIKENVVKKKIAVNTRLLEETGIIETILEFFGLSSLQNESLEQIESLNQQVQLLNEKAMASFNQVEDMIIAKSLPDEILQRHYDTVEKYQQGFTRLQQYIQQATTADSLQQQQQALDQFNSFMQEQQFKRKQQAFDPNDLPNKVLQPNKSNTPKTTRDEFIQGGLIDTPPIRLAALGELNYDQLDQADDPAYLAETDEVVLTQAIRDKAQELEYDAVKIYHWVRNNIEWQPAWGAVQNAELTLSAQRGNAMDIASLTIALLRASQIPARYVHGTIEVPEQEYMNWMGGFTNLDAAANYASSNGIPTTGIISGGQINKIQMEHVWVEAATDYYPSRGVINKNADIWLELDPSFKQYEFQRGLDGVAISNIDSAQLGEDFVATGTINEAESWVTGFDSTFVQQMQEQIQQSLSDHISNSLSDPAAGDIIGEQKTIIREYPSLPAGLPNLIVTSGARYDKVPVVLQQRISWGLGKDIFGQAINPVSFPFSIVNSKKITLSFRPATAQDQEALELLLPEGGDIDISQLPTSIPSYLISVVPELKLNGVVFSSGNRINLGQEIDLVTNVRFAGIGRSNEVRSYSVIAGSYLVVNAFSQNVSQHEIRELQHQLEITDSILESTDDEARESLTRQEALGDMFYSAGLSYYSQLMILSRIMGFQSGNHYTLVAGMGTIGYEPSVSSFFGIPRSISAGGIAFDIPLIYTSNTNNGDVGKAQQFSLQAGILSSALEHSVPEQMFSNRDLNQPSSEAISAVKALAKANTAGQKIYQISKDNMIDVLPNIHHDIATMREIRASLDAGKFVITHTDQVSVLGWSGAGYIILDPESGAGAYKISGGRNGSFLDTTIEKFETALNWLSIIEKSLGKSWGATAVKSVIKKVKKVIQVMKDMLEIIKNCEALSLAAIPIYLGALVFASAIFTGIVATGAFLGSALCSGHPACGVVGGLLFAGPALDAFTFIMDSANDALSCK